VQSITDDTINEEQESKKNQKKKMTAVMAAVAAYIQSQQEAQMAMSGQPVPSPSPVAVVEKIMPDQNAWGLSGRQAQMQMRHLVQMKSFHGARLK
jgi:hypothetical protein